METSKTIPSTPIPQTIKYLPEPGMTESMQEMETISYMEEKETTKSDPEVETIS